MVAVAELSRRKRLEDRVVLGARSGQDDVLWPREFDDDALEPGEPRGV